jgi:hypothetical protein
MVYTVSTLQQSAQYAVMPTSHCWNNNLQEIDHVDKTSSY